MVFGGGEEMWFADCLLTPSKSSEKPLVGGKAGEEVSSTFGELPALGFQIKAARNES